MNCKPGDLAVVVGAWGAGAHNNGHIVEVLHLEKPPTTWAVKTCGEVLIWKDGVTIPVPPGTVCTCPDEHLRPISGTPIHEEELDECPTTV